MADEIPASLRQADINLFKCAQRAAQLGTVKPIVAYWCEYFVVNQILAKQLHNNDVDVLEYTTKLMDKLEQTKQEYPNEEAIMDDTAAQAYIEQFGQETLDRAQRVVKANKVTVQTAGTFDAAATFFNLVHIWGTPDPENLQKIKYAKWNAARIYKAIKEGKDPNESNPKLEDLEEQPAVDPADPEAQQLTSPGDGEGPKPVTLEEVPDRELRRDSAGVSLPHTPASMAQPPADDELVLPSAPPTAPQGYFDGHAPPEPPSPISPPLHDPVSYEPPAEPTALDPDIEIPSPPSAHPEGPPASTYQPPSAPAPPTFAASPKTTPAVAPPPTSPPDTFMNTPPSATIPRPVIPQPGAPPVAPVATSSYARPAATQQQHKPQGNFATDDMAIMAAQKHAKWAISALNFEDVPTAVRELRKALEALNAS